MTRVQVVAVLLAAVGAACWVLALAGFAVADYVELRPWWELRFALAIAGSVAAALAWVLGVRHSVLTPAGLALLVVTAVVVAAGAWLAAVFRTDVHDVSRVAAPGGDMEVVVASGSGFIAIDPLILLRVQTDAGLFSREVEIGCINTDIARFDGVEWADSRTLRVRLSPDEVHEIAFDGRGEPDRTVRRGC